MHLKSMVLEGFKSYGKRQEIKGFDREFNAITGLNGSGKSNILDGICFVLGITNLSQVRATSLQELIYKNGQAGITKASVTIIFDNSDRDSSPLGYEQYNEISVTRQIAMGGKNKYLINGTNVQNKRVQDLFCSVQLNVNNPHFLIMQGRITKVLNMKPLEILSMIEEAAGTKMYENKKQMAQKTIEKKEAKLKELNSVINEEITPKIEKLKEEQKQYMEYQRMNRELDKLTKLYIAWQYKSILEGMKETDNKVKGLEDQITSTKAKIASGDVEVKEIEGVVVELEKEKNKALGPQVHELEEKLREKEKNEARAQAGVKNIDDALERHGRKMKLLEKTLKEHHTNLSAKQKEQAGSAEVFDNLRTAVQEDAKALAEAEKRFQAVSTGLLSNEDGEAATLQSQLIAAKQELSNIETERRQSEMQIDHLQKRLKEREIEMRSTAKDNAKDEALLDKKQQEVESLEATLESMGIKDGQLEGLQEQRRSIINEVRKLRDIVENFEDRNPLIYFKYNDPEPNFNRSSVLGIVCKSIKVKDMSMARALQVATGAKLYNVIVDTELTGKKLLERGNLRHRTTFIPLNKIKSYTISQSVIRTAQNLVGEENVWSALSVVEFDPKLRAAMEFVFGQALICTDLDIAKKVAFHPGIQKKAVTLDGDVVDPAGVLSGGAPEQTVPILHQLNEISKKYAELDAKNKALENVEATLNSLSKVADRYREIKQRLELCNHEMEILRRKLAQTTHHQCKQEVEELRQTIANLKETIKTCLEKEVRGSKRVGDLEYKVQNAAAIREKELKEAENDMKHLRKQAEVSRNKWRQREEECESLQLEIKDLENGIEEMGKEIEGLQKEIDDVHKKKEGKEKECEGMKAEVANLRSELNEIKKVINAKNEEIQNALGRKEKIVSERDDLLLDIKKMEHEVEQIQDSSGELQAKVESIEKKYEWVKRDKNFFGSKGGAYDYTGMDMPKMGKTINALETQQKELGRNINVRAMNMLGKEEEQYAELMRKKGVVENDKMKIVEVIRELDEKKNVALRKAWDQVNKDFGSIFSSLLPGTRARLSPPEGRDVLDGLEIRVGFGDTWKESLNELSGGQRSLVALSLILSMLLFSPAPIYILDEVDAALDLSHTQNIGTMLRKHFKHSQFIVVSLKDGMFTNANVLFRTQFIDGMSTVTRHVQKRN